MSDDKISFEEMQERLARAETTLGALRRGEVDIVVGSTEPLVVRFKPLVDEKERLRTLLNIVRRINQLIIHEDEPQRLLQSAVDCLCERGLFLAARIVQIDESGKTVLSVESGEIVLKGVRGVSEVRSQFPCLTKVAESSGPMVIAEPIPACDECGVAGCLDNRCLIGVPLHHAGEVFGALMISAPRFMEKETDAHKLCGEIGGDLGFAMFRIRKAVAHKRVSEENAALQEQLQQTQKVEAIGRLAGGVAHDFNNMLSIILGYGENLLNQLHHGDPLREDVEEIVDAGKRSAMLTHQLLAFSRKQTLQPEVLDLNDVVRNLGKMLHRLIGEDIELKTHISSDLARVMADPGQIEQVIMNLAVNARDAMPTGGKLIIETANVALDEAYARHHVNVKPGKYVLLAVTDTGCGIEKDVLSQVFDPFFTTKEKGKGTGMGLSTVYGIVKQSSGNVWVYSEPGKGTTFKIYLPQTDAEPEMREGAAEKEKIKGGGEYILVVEDDAPLRRLCDRMLSGLGYRVTLAANGGEALLLMEEKGLKPDLVITDVIMPEMSGAVLVDRLRRNRPDLKVIYMSGYTDNAIVYHGVLDPGTPFIQKPFTFRDIAEKVQAVLRGEAPDEA